MIGIRKSLDLLFTRRELKILDDVMPETTKRKEEDQRELDTTDVSTALCGTSTVEPSVAP